MLIRWQYKCNIFNHQIIFIYESIRFLVFVPCKQKSHPRYRQTSLIGIMEAVLYWEGKEVIKDMKINLYAILLQFCGILPKERGSSLAEFDALYEITFLQDSALQIIVRE
jgi:hypothetical protein